MVQPASDIRTMLFLGEDWFHEHCASHYQLMDKNRTQSFGFFTDDGIIRFGYGTIEESKRAFRTHVSAEEEYDEWKEINDVV